VQWLDGVAFAEAALGLALAAGNTVYFVGYFRRTRLTARRVGAGALAVVNAGLAMEAGLYVAALQPSGLPEGELVSWAAVLLVRSVLLAASAIMGVLILRQAGGPSAGPSTSSGQGSGRGGAG